MELYYLGKILLMTAVCAPFAGAVALAVMFPYFGGRSAKAVGLLTSAVSLVAALALWGIFAGEYSDTLGFAFKTSEKLFGLTVAQFALNSVSMPMFALAAIVGFAASVWAANSELNNAKLYFLLMMIMQGGLFGAFASVNILWMYIFHEFALVPTFIAMSIWGGAGRRMAAMEMAVYLTAGALVSLVGIIALKEQVASDSFSLSDIVLAAVTNPLDASWQYVIFGLLMFGLGALVSLFPFYSWAPRAYAAAPTSFAMLHAGVLKKFGLYVIIQAVVPFVSAGCADWSKTLAVLALFNVIYIGAVTMAQRDLKLMVSYSSVSHMGLCFLGIASMSVLGSGGAVLLMFGHGLSAALTFMLANAVVNRTGEWDMHKMGGLYKQTPVLASFFLAATLAGIGLPGFANFWGEFSVLISLWDFSPTICALAASGIIISAVYGLRAFAMVFMGEPSAEISAHFAQIPDMSAREKIPAAILVAALLFAGFFPKSITDGLDTTLSAVPALTQSK